MQSIMEQNATSAGLPGRAELDSAHRKIADLERLVRRIQRNAEAGEEAASPPCRKTAPTPVAKPRPATRPKPAAKKAAKPAARKTASPVKPARKAAPANRRKR